MRIFLSRAVGHACSPVPSPDAQPFAPVHPLTRCTLSALLCSALAHVPVSRRCWCFFLNDKPRHHTLGGRPKTKTMISYIHHAYLPPPGKAGDFLGEGERGPAGLGDGVAQGARRGLEMLFAFHAHACLVLVARWSRRRNRKHASQREYIVVAGACRGLGWPSLTSSNIFTRRPISTQYHTETHRVLVASFVACIARKCCCELGACCFCSPAGNAH